MSFSTDTILHQTDKKGFYGILNDRKFRLQYCKEVLTGISNGISFYFPIVSFSDIPFSSLNQYLNLYGEYTIGISKNWAKVQSLNPVLYLESKSFLSELMVREMGNLTKDFHNQYVQAFVKNYEGPLKTKSKAYSNYRFSDEREWRYAPDPYSINFDKFLLPEEEFKDKEEDYRKFAFKLGPSFWDQELRYLIVPTITEVHELRTRFKENPLLNIFTHEQVLKDIIGGNANIEIPHPFSLKDKKNNPCNNPSKNKKR